nr:hypothetical protein CFP56_43280 [Quercus suber]
MDVIDLGKEFFLTRFSCKEDHDMVLKKVWIRLNELPIEYYEVEVLKQIGNSVGKVLRINTHTAAEARGRFARLYVQVDIDKPLVTNILIGGIHQPVNYEGIHKLCFSCGRIGHRKEAYPYTLRSSPKSDKDNDNNEDVPVSNSHEGYDLVDPKQGEAPRSPKQEDTYGPSVVVTKKRQGNRGARNKPEGSGIGYLRVSGGTAYLNVGAKSNHMKVDKTKAEEAHLTSQAQSPKAMMSTNNGLKNMGYSKGAIFLTDAKQMGQFNQGVATTQAKSASVKGKKEFTCSKAHISLKSVGILQNKLHSPPPQSLAMELAHEVIQNFCSRP